MPFLNPTGVLIRILQGMNPQVSWIMNYQPQTNPMHEENTPEI